MVSPMASTATRPYVLPGEKPTATTVRQAILNWVVAEVAASDPPEVAQLVMSTLDFVVHNLPVQPLEQIAPKDEYNAGRGERLGLADGGGYDVNAASGGGQRVSRIE